MTSQTLATISGGAEGLISELVLVLGFAVEMAN